MARHERVDVKAILADPDLRRKLMVRTIQATQAREGIDTTEEQAERAYYVVTEGERTTFFDLEGFRQKKGQPERRHEVFIQHLRSDPGPHRFDVIRRDFRTIGRARLAYRRIGLIAHVFRQNPPLDPAIARARRGAYTGNDPRYVRYWWEIAHRVSDANGFTWEPFARGGAYCRFYADVELVVHWDPVRRTFARFFGRKGRETERPESLDDFFKPGLTWSRRTQRGFSLRVMPQGCVFADKAPALFPVHEPDKWFLLGLANSAPAEYLLKGLASFGSWEVGVIKRLPVPQPVARQHETVGTMARKIHDAKATWDGCNEPRHALGVPG